MLSGKHSTKEWVERVVILGPPAGVTGANLQSKSKWDFYNAGQIVKPPVWKMQV